jgi:two-component system, NarL family, response regulator DevR
MARSRQTGPPSAAPIRIVVVEPQPILGVGVREVLDREPDIEVVAWVGTLGEAGPAIVATDPDVVLVDVDFPQPEATQSALRMHQGAPESDLIVMGGDEGASIVEAVEIGATAHVASTARPAELASTIRRVADGEDPLKDELMNRPDLVERIVDDIRDSLAVEYPPTHPLSPREFEVLMYVGAGLRNRQIAETLGLSERTIKNHVTAILHKLGAPNRTRAVMYAVRQGWLDLGEAPGEPPGEAGRS